MKFKVGDTVVFTKQEPQRSTKMQVVEADTYDYGGNPIFNIILREFGSQEERVLYVSLQTMKELAQRLTDAIKRAGG